MSVKIAPSILSADFAELAPASRPFLPPTTSIST